MSNDAHEFWDGLVDQFGRALKSAKSEIETVGAVSGNAYQTYKAGQPFDPYSASLSRVSNNPPVVGSRVFVTPMADGTKAIVGKVYESGENDTYILADSSQVPAGPIAGTRIVTLANSFGIGPLANVTLTANQVHYCPIYIAQDFSVSGLYINVSTLVAGNLLLELYDCVPMGFGPNSKIGASTLQAVAATGQKVFTITPTGPFKGGRWYFVAACASTAMGVSGSTTFGNFPSLRGQTPGDFLTNTNLLMRETLAAGWTSLPTVPSAGTGPTNTYLHVGIQIS